MPASPGHLPLGPAEQAVVGGWGGSLPPRGPQDKPLAAAFSNSGPKMQTEYSEDKRQDPPGLLGERPAVGRPGQSVRTAESCSMLRKPETRPGEVPPHSCQNNLIGKMGGQVLCRGRKREPPCSLGGNVSPCNHYGNSKAMPQKPKECRTIQEFHFWVFSKKKKKKKKKNINS